MAPPRNWPTSSSPILPRPCKVEVRLILQGPPRSRWPVKSLRPCPRGGAPEVAHYRDGPYYGLWKDFKRLRGRYAVVQLKRVLMAKISLIVNGNPVNANVDPRTL